MIRAEGKFFTCGTAPFTFRGLHHDLSGDVSTDDFDEQCRQRRAAGFTVLAVPAADARLLEAAGRHDLRVLLSPATDGWEKLIGASRPVRGNVLQDLAANLRRQLHGLRSADGLLGVALAHGLDARVRAGLGRRGLTQVAAHLAAAVRQHDPDLLVSWTGTWPTDTFCPTAVDYLTVDLDLERIDDLEPALLAAHRSVGDRPLVLGRLRVGGRAADPVQADEHVVEAALRTGAGGSFAQSWSPAAADAYRAMNARTVASLEVDWPTVSVVVCAFNEEATLEECLSHCDRLDYPGLEILVVDDGSTDATPRIAESHPRARLLRVPHVGLAAARNAGYQAASGALIAYLDADAYPTPQWVRYLALAALGDGLGGSGGPNVPPARDPEAAQLVARSPGGPIPELFADDRAVHVPGCNMAFWKTVLEDLAGFDPALWSAEDVEFEWRVRRTGAALGYHPAALIWHHRRPGIRPYLRQQRNYGRGQALTERRYPERHPRTQVLSKLAGALRTSAGATGADNGSAPSRPVAYRSLFWQERPMLDLAHQWGLPLAALTLTSAPLGLVRPALGAPALGAGAFVAGLFCADVALAGSGTELPGRGVRPRLFIASCHVLRPLAYRWGKWTQTRTLRRNPPEWPPTPEELSRAAGVG